MWTNARRRTRLIIGLSVLLILVFHTTPGHGDLDISAPSPATGSAVLSARQSAEEAVLAVAEFNDLTAEASAITVQEALLTARRQVRAAQTKREDDQAGPVRVRSVAQRLAPTPAPSPVAQPAVARVPILMYHHVASAPPGSDAVRRDLSVDPVAFVKQMEYLHTNGYHVVSLADAVERLQNGGALPDKPIVLTFDDGYDDNYSLAFPIIRHYGFSATFFIISDVVGESGYASWQQIAEMARADMDIEPHGRTHSDLAVSSLADAVWQIAGSKKILEEKLGHPVRFYCYPSGRYTAQTIAVLSSNGFVAAVTTTYGATHTASDMFQLSRVRIRGADTLEQFAIKVETAP